MAIKALAVNLAPTIALMPDVAYVEYGRVSMFGCRQYGTLCIHYPVMPLCLCGVCIT